MKNNLYLKMVAIIACLACLIFTVACNNNSATNGEEGTTTQTDTDADNMNLEPPTPDLHVPSIQVSSIDEIVNVLKNSDIQNYHELLQPKYNELFSTLNSSGFIYTVDITDDINAEDAINFLVRDDGENIFFLMPYARYEDLGIISYVMFRGELYQVCIYAADKEVLSKTETISEYIRTRLTLKIVDEMVVNDNLVCFMLGGDAGQKNLAASFVDDNYYYYVRTEATKDELKTFLNVLSFEKTFIE